MLESTKIDTQTLRDYWDLDRKPAALIWTCDFVEHPEWKKPTNQNLKYFEIAGSLGHMKNQPVHENITIAALARARAYNADQSETLDGIADPILHFSDKDTRNWAQDQFEFIRGVVWNDDPVCALFVDLQDTNSAYGIGADWFAQFKGLDVVSRDKKEGVETNLIRRSHFGDLQFLYSMASSQREQAGETKRKIMIWLEVMYRLAAGDGPEHERITEWKQIKETKLKEFFSDTSEPKETATLRDLLLGWTKL